MYDASDRVYRRNPYAVREKKKRKEKKGRFCLLLLSVTVCLGICAFSVYTVLQASGGPGGRSEQAEAMPEALASPEHEPEAGELIQEETREEAPVVMLDAGHGGMDEGCRGTSVLEKDVNLGIVLLAKAKLEALGYQVLLTREDDTLVTKEERVELANLYRPDIFVSIHQNTYEDKSISGLETWYDGTDASRDSRRLAQLIHRETLKSTGALARELRDEAQLYVTGKTAMPACLIETGFLSNEEECARLAEKEYQEQAASGIVSGIDLYFHPKTMYLTFDDGPSAENTSAVLDILKARNIQATFFVVGENVRRNPEVAKRIVAEGHTIGIHCNRHDYGEIYRSADSYLEDFEEAFHTVREVTGVEPVLYRFPGGSINSYNEPVREEIIEKMRERGFIYYDWNCSLEDAVREATTEELIAAARETALDRKKVVLLGHDIVYQTVLCLEELIDEFAEYEMKPLTPEQSPVQFH